MKKTLTITCLSPLKGKEQNEFGDEPKPETFNDKSWDYAASWQRWHNTESSLKEYTIQENDEVAELAKEHCDKIWDEEKVSISKVGFVEGYNYHAATHPFTEDVVDWERIDAALIESAVGAGVDDSVLSEIVQFIKIKVNKQLQSLTKPTHSIGDTVVCEVIDETNLIAQIVNSK
jgi:hypothetical protein